MPWLEKDKVLFIHVPRCGGTSLTKHHKVGIKAQEGKMLYRRIGIRYFNYRYRLLESTNFPLLTIENLIALCQWTLAFILFFTFGPGLPVPYVMWTSGTSLFLTSTFIWTAPVLMRTDFVRLLFMYIQYYALYKFNEDTNYLIGVNMKGYLLHLTAERCVRYGYVDLKDIKTKSFSIVRNPYSRVVSMFEYNKRLFESFDHFVVDFHRKCMKTYHKEHKTDSRDIYCHVLPMYAYTHIEGRQVVNTIIKQEQLKRLVSTEWRESGVPVQIQQALTGIPHANSRKKKMPWQQYYSQKTMDLVLEMYEKDFDIFGYDKHIASRPDLKPKIRTSLEATTKESTEATDAGTFLRHSMSQDFFPLNEFRSQSSSKEVQIKSPNSQPDKIQEEFAARKEDDIEKIQSGSRDIEKGVDLSLRRAATSAGEDTIEKIAGIEKQNELVKQRTESSMSVSEQKELVRKKRAASAFVLHVA